MHCTLKPVSLGDSKLLYQLLKERPPHANISHKKMPSMDEHEAFIKSSPYSHWYIIQVNDLGSVRDVGAVYLTDRNEIGIAILKKFQRKGCAGSGIRELMRLHKRDQYLANIAPQNLLSKRLFKGLGFETIQFTMSK